MLWCVSRGGRHGLIQSSRFLQAKELDANTDYYIELLAKGIGKPKEEIAKDIQRPKYFQAQEAIAYGIADKTIDSRDAAFEKRVARRLPPLPPAASSAVLGPVWAI